MSAFYFNPGELRKRITFQKLMDLTNEVGDTVQAPQDYLTTYAKIEVVKPMTLKGGEYLDNQKARPELIYSITTRYHSGITPDMLITYGSRIFQIIGILNWEERDLYLTIECIEKVEV